MMPCRLARPPDALHFIGRNCGGHRFAASLTRNLPMWARLSPVQAQYLSQITASGDSLIQGDAMYKAISGDLPLTFVVVFAVVLVFLSIIARAIRCFTTLQIEDEESKAPPSAPATAHRD